MKRSIFILSFFTSLHADAQFSSPLVIDSSFTIPVKCISVADVDNDGDRDIIAAMQKDTIYWYENDNGIFTQMQPVSTTSFYPVHIDTGDVNSDGFTDLLITNDGGQGSANPVSVILYLNNAGTSFTEKILDDTIIATAVKSYFSDIDNDGDLDVISCHDLEIALYQNAGGIFSARTILATGAEFYNLVVNDFTGDGFEDFAVNSSAGVRIYQNNQNSTFTIIHTLTSDLFGFLFSNDIDLDGDDDLIFPSVPAIDLSTFINDGAGNFQHLQTTNFNLANEPNAPFVSMDLNGDLFPDALYTTAGTTGLYKKMNDGSGLFGNPALVDSAFPYNHIFVDDLDGDGDNDIIWAGFRPFGARYLGVFKNESVSSVAELQLSESPIFPNPFSETLHFISSFDASRRVEITDSYGRLMYLGSGRAGSLNTTGWPAGFYILKSPGTAIKLVKIH